MNTKTLSPEVQQTRERLLKERVAQEDRELSEAKSADLKKKWKAVEKPNNPSAKQLQARIEVLEEMLGLR